MDKSAPTWCPKQQANPDHEKACSIIKSVFNIDVPYSAGFALTKLVAKMAKNYKEFIKLEGFNKYRSDHAHNCHRFIAFGMLHTNLDNNIVFAPRRVGDKWVYTEVDNKYFSKQLGLSDSCIDDVIFTCRTEGYYFSQERYEYELDSGKKVFKGKKSVKRFAVKLIAEMVESVTDFVRACAQHAKKAVKFVSDQQAKFGFQTTTENTSRGYAKSAAAQRVNRRLKRERRKAERIADAKRRLDDEKQKQAQSNARPVLSESQKQDEKDRRARMIELAIDGHSREKIKELLALEFPHLSTA
ncbi:hypothetical protein [Vibrio aquimaris]|uniref:Uncharacterized protein n=1 Tax=Vibrio aquimaris TaxID=2587862 RepID=A0A5P9CRD6_9VIBR|nr:hypothetical protein [Vibrio aquimaris]QFT28825.1 hypothetical protein FIV01_20700 [Vibrio aquimaris]